MQLPNTHLVRKLVHFPLGCCCSAFTSVSIRSNKPYRQSAGGQNVCVYVCVFCQLICVFQTVKFCMWGGLGASGFGQSFGSLQWQPVGQIRRGETLTQAVQPATSPAALGPVWQGQQEGQLSTHTCTHTPTLVCSSIPMETLLWLSVIYWSFL